MSHLHEFRVKYALVVMMSAVGPIAAAHADSAADASISTQATAALHVALGVRVSAVALETNNARVTLYGTVRTKRDKTNTAEVVRHVPGVVGVRNLLQVVTPPNRVRTKRSDDVIKADVRRALSADHALDDSHITVTSVSNGVVLLGGSAASMDDDIRALRATADRPGVRQVFSAIEAVASVRSDRVDGDDVIRRGVTRALNDLDVRENADIRVHVADGVVWLNGTVPTWEGNSDRLYAVRSVTGVRSVVNGLKVIVTNGESR